MHECMDESEDEGPVKVCSGIRGCGGREAGIYSVATTTIAVTSALSVASGSRIFQPNAMSWS